MMLPVLVAVKDRVNSRWPKIGYDRQVEFEAVISLTDELLNAILDDTDLSDFRAASLLAAISAFIDSTYLPDRANDQEDDV
jgi:hypothetical protein